MDGNYKKIREDLLNFKKSHDIFEKKITKNCVKIHEELDLLKKLLDKDDKSTDETFSDDQNFEFQELEIGEKVLAKWPDDNWYYECVVIDKKGDFYTLKDNVSDMEDIRREDIVSLRDKDYSFSIGDCVIAEHPSFTKSFAPGEIVRLHDDHFIIKFYDSIECCADKYQIFKIPKFKYQTDINSIIQSEREWIGQKVVFRNSKKKIFEFGRVLSRLGNEKALKIISDQGEEIVQKFIHIFGLKTRKRAIKEDDFVLAPFEDYFLPAKVNTCNRNLLKVVFVNGKE